MTLAEVGNLQIGDQVQLSTGVIATVKTVNAANQLIAIDMLGGNTTPIHGEIPPDKQNAETLVICAWLDLVNATKI